jgi:hypothetical protein
MLFDFWFQTKKKNSPSSDFNYWTCINLNARILFVLFCCCCSVLLNQNEWLDQQYSQYFDLDAFIVKFFVCAWFFFRWETVQSLTHQESDGGLYQVLLIKNQMGVCTKFYSSRIRWGSVPRFTYQESDEGLYQVLLIKNLGTDPHQILDE